MHHSLSDAVEPQSTSPFHHLPRRRYRRVAALIAIPVGLFFGVPSGQADTPLGAPQVAVSPMVTSPQGGGEIESTVVAPGLKKKHCASGRILITNDASFQQLRVGAALDATKTRYAVTTAVSGYDLDGKKATPYPSTFEVPFPKDPKQSAYRPQTNTDHDIVTLNDGTVLLLVMGESVNPDHVPYPTKDNDWFNYSFAQDGGSPNKIILGPGARTVIYVWRSEDCGATFNWVSEIDPAKFDVIGKDLKKTSTDGSCAMPQVYIHGTPIFFVSLDGTTIGDDPNTFYFPVKTTPQFYPVSTTVPPIFGAKTFKGYNQGGTDGNLAWVDRRDSSVYVTFGCVGSAVGSDPNMQTHAPQQKFVLDGNLKSDGKTPRSAKAINKTIVFRSRDGGVTWAQVAELPVQVWRGSVAPFNQPKFNQPKEKKLAFMAGPAVMIGTVQPKGGPVTFGANSTSPKLVPDAWWWSELPTNRADPAKNILYGNITWSTFIVRGPVVDNHETLLVSYPTDGSLLCVTTWKPCQFKGHGQALLLYDTVTNQLAPMQPVAPRSNDPKDFIVHLTAIDVGDGPILLYWLDVSTANRQATVIGRVVFPDGKVSNDFLISQVPPPPGKSCTATVTEPCEYKLNLPGDFNFWGDYRTGSGFSTVVGSHNLYKFYPTWIEPSHPKGASAQFAEVTVDMGLEFSSQPVKPFNPFAQTSDTKPDTKYIVAAPSGAHWRKASPRLTLKDIGRHRLMSEADMKAKHRKDAADRR